MTEVESEESFVFVDKRKLAADTPVGGDAAQESAETPDLDEAITEPVAASSEGLEQAEAEQFDEDASGLAGSHGLVAYVVGLIASDAWQKLGLIADPGTGKVVKDLKQARFSIDCVAALVAVIENSETELPNELRRDLQRALADLRLNFVEQSRR